MTPFTAVAAEHLHVGSTLPGHADTVTVIVVTLLLCVFITVCCLPGWSESKKEKPRSGDAGWAALLITSLLIAPFSASAFTSLLWGGNGNTRTPAEPTSGTQVICPDSTAAQDVECIVDGSSMYVLHRAGGHWWWQFSGGTWTVVQTRKVLASSPYTRDTADAAVHNLTAQVPGLTITGDAAEAPDVVTVCPAGKVCTATYDLVYDGYVDSDSGPHVWVVEQK